MRFARSGGPFTLSVFEPVAPLVSTARTPTEWRPLWPRSGVHWKVSFEPLALARLRPSTHSSIRLTRRLPLAVARSTCLCEPRTFLIRTLGLRLPPSLRLDAADTVTVNGADWLELPAVSYAATAYV